MTTDRWRPEGSDDLHRGRCGIREADPEPESDGDYSHWNEEAEIVRRAENPEISGNDYPPDPYDDY